MGTTGLSLNHLQTHSLDENEKSEIKQAETPLEFILVQAADDAKKWKKGNEEAKQYEKEIKQVDKYEDEARQELQQIHAKNKEYEYMKPISVGEILEEVEE